MQRFKEKFHLFNHTLWTFISPIIITTVTTILLVIFYDIFKYHDLWFGMREAVGNAQHFCELNRFGELVVQPSNTWSNLGFLLVGIYCLSIGIRDSKYPDKSQISNLLAKTPQFSYLIGISAIILFIGSFFYHASLTYFFQKLDQNGIYFVLISLFSYNIFKLKPTLTIKGKKISTHRFIIFSSVLLMILFFTFIWKVNIMILFPSMIILFFATNILTNKLLSDKIQTYRKALNIGVLTLLLSGFIWIMDITDIICIPTSMFQGHALWHILNAATIMIVYLYYRGEKIYLN